VTAIGLIARRRVVIAGAACLLAAVASLPLPAGVQSDPGGWVIWGRELIDGTLDTRWYPSWKPLPVVVTAPAALAGHAAPVVWLLAERAVAIAGLVLAATLAWRAAGPVAGALAGVGLLLLPGWSRYALTGAIEPVVVTCLLAALAVRRADRTAAGLGLLALAALGRVEAAALLAAATLGWTRGRARALAIGAGLLVLVPAAWLAGDWVGAGRPLEGGMLARASGPAILLQRRPHPELRVLHQVPTVVPLPVLVLAALGLALAVPARRRLEPALAIGAVLWIVADMALVGLGYPAVARFVLPAGALVVVLAALGAARALAAVRVRPAAGAAVAAVVQAGAAWARAPAMAADVARLQSLQHEAAGLAVAVDRAGGPAHLRACGAATVQPFRTRLAWDLGTAPETVRGVRAAGVRFVPRRGGGWETIVRRCRGHARHAIPRERSRRRLRRARHHRVLVLQGRGG
jgi:hypothetical protein